MKQEKQVRISIPAYEELRRRSRDSKYHTRGITGVVDDLVLGRFTTPGSGRAFGSKNKKTLEREKAQNKAWHLETLALL